ncbi:hypothetical protein AB6A40_003821 [Gnathostoma spinigerum]|uniref:Uncharacterized protein n=1 Tax=Gnathostoma spinigerum TaxID=75299 RepID=A0ABD6ECW5_9BILA
MSERDVTKVIQKYVDKRDDRLVSIVERCLRKGYDYDKMKDRVLDHVRDLPQKKKIVEALSDAFPQFARKRKHKFEESKKDTNGEEKKKKLEDKPVLTTIPPPPAVVKPVVTVAPTKVVKEQVTVEELKSKELMYQAQMAIEERKRQLNLTAKPSILSQNVILNSSKLKPEEASMFMNYSMEKINRVKELKEKLARSSLFSSTKKPADQTSNAEKQKTAEEEKIVEYLDPRISLKTAQRKQRAIVFHEKGDFERLAHRQRAKARLAMLQSEISQIAKRTGMSSSVKLAMLTPASASSDVHIPEIEWWDEIVLGAADYDAIPPKDMDADERYKHSISNLVEHPIQLKPPDEPLHPQYLKVYLTSRERKKIRRQNRKEAQKEKTEKIRLGLEKAPEPKVKLSNLMRVLGSDAIQDPTRMEAHVRKQMAERQRKHLNENAARKLTKEQRAEKKARKIKEDANQELHAAVYRVKSLTHPAKKFKLEMNAKELHMTGIILLHANVNLVVVEGGPKQQKFFKNLMMNRIKWADEIIGQKKDVEDKEVPGERNQCDLIWEGFIKRRTFGEIKCVSATIEKQAREIFEKHEVVHYWDLAYSTTVLQEQNAD